MKLRQVQEALAYVSFMGTHIVELQALVENSDGFVIILPRNLPGATVRVGKQDKMYEPICKVLVEEIERAREKQRAALAPLGIEL